MHTLSLTCICIFDNHIETPQFHRTVNTKQNHHRYFLRIKLLWNNTSACTRISDKLAPLVNQTYSVTSSPCSGGSKKLAPTTQWLTIMRLCSSSSLRSMTAIILLSVYNSVDSHTNKAMTPPTRCAVDRNMLPGERVVSDVLLKRLKLGQ